MRQGLKPRFAAIALVLLAMSMLPSAADAAQPGGSAVDQYSEGIPGATGDRPATDKGAGSLPAQTEAQLRKQGKEGAAAADLAKATSPNGGVGSGSGTGGMGVLLPLLLVASLLGAVALFIARRRQSATPG